MGQKASSQTAKPEFWVQGDPEKLRNFDAIVVGSGAAGGVAATHLCNLGLNVFVLEAGQFPSDARRPLTGALSSATKALIDHGIDRSLPPPVIQAGEKLIRGLGRLRQPVQSKLYAWAFDPKSLVDDVDCPYVSDGDDAFHWFRSHQPGGRMFVPGHGRQYYRLGGMGSARDESGLARWPFDASELEPWYASVEQTLRLRGGVFEAGSRPVADLAVTLEPSGPERQIYRVLKARWPSAEPILGYHAPPANWLDIAGATGRLKARAGAVVRRVLRIKAGRAEGVEWFDCETQSVRKASAPIVFLCASTIESTRILMLSADDPGAEVVGMHSRVLGCGLMDHAKASAVGFTDSLPGIEEHPDEPGRSIYVLPGDTADRPFGMQIHIHPRAHGNARVDLVSFAEILPEDHNRVTLDPKRKDAFGMPVPKISFRYSEAQRNAGRHQIRLLREVGEALGLSHVTVSKELAAPGTAVHESGTARMGTDPALSVVDPNNECWDAKGLFVTDGACFPRLAVQNPTLAIMALTARAAAYAVGATR